MKNQWQEFPGPGLEPWERSGLTGSSHCKNSQVVSPPPTASAASAARVEVKIGPLAATGAAFPFLANPQLSPS